MTIIQPKYTINLPSDNKKIQYRPFVIKEEKALLLSLEEGNIDDIAGSIRNLLLACTDNEYDSNERPYYDSEYLFLKIRSKSIGEVIDLVGKCECDDSVKNEFVVDIDEDLRIDPPVKNHEPFSVPNTSMHLKFRHPSISNFLELNDKKDNSNEILARCITEIYNNEEILEKTHSEKVDILENMTSLQQKDLKKFLAEMPMIKLDAKYKCKACGKHHHQILSGFENFFV